MTFLQKFVISPAIGAAAAFAGYAVYQRRRLASGAPKPVGEPSSEPAAAMWKLAESVEQLTSRVTALEARRTDSDWLEVVGTRFTAMEERLTVQNERIQSVESNYHAIEQNLDAILRALDKQPGTEDHLSEEAFARPAA